MRYERTDAERRSDDALLLTLWAQAQRLGPEKDEELQVAGDKLKLMKLAFLAAYRLYQDNIKALNLEFFRFSCCGEEAPNPAIITFVDFGDYHAGRRKLVPSHPYRVGEP